MKKNILLKIWGFIGRLSLSPSCKMNAYVKGHIDDNVLPRIKRYDKQIPAKNKFKSIMSINTEAGIGGAARVAYDMLCVNFRSMGFKTRFLCDRTQIKSDPDIIILKRSDDAINSIFNENGYLDLDHDSYKIKEMDCFKEADIIHLHNLHGGYFNPAFLPELTALKPTIWSLHDEQAITGHCAYSFTCEKWRTGCGNCPDLDYYPSLEVDRTKYLWDIKKKIYENSDLMIVTPSKWLKQKVEKSILKDKDIRCIYHGIDENVWKPYDKKRSREDLNLPQDKMILLFIANCSIDNPQKGGSFILDAIKHYQNNEDILFLVVGGEAKIDYANVISRGYVHDKTELAKYYSSADLFVFPTLVEAFGFVTIEAMACGTPVVSFNYSATPELVKHMESGYLAKYRDLNDFIAGIDLFINDDGLRRQASVIARERYLERFTLKKCLNSYLDLYNELWDRSLNK